MDNPIRLGLVGIGRAGYGMHVPELKNRKDKYIFVAACDLIEERRKKMEDELGCKTYSDIKDLVNDPNVEMVTIATRSCDHFAHAMLAIEAGKDVLIEKPMCVTTEQAEILKAIDADPTKPRIFTRFNRRFEQHFNRIREIMDLGLLGEVNEIHITRNGYNRRDDWQMLLEFSGGNLLNWGPHLVDQSLCMLGAKVKSVHSDLRHTVGAGDAEDHVIVTMTGENGRTVTYEICNDKVLETPEYEVFGTRGALKVIGEKLHMKYIDPEQILPQIKASRETPGQTFGSTGTFEMKDTIRWIESEESCGVGDLSVIWDYMYDSYRNGAKYPISMEEAVNVIRYINEAKIGTPFETK